MADIFSDKDVFGGSSKGMDDLPKKLKELSEASDFLGKKLEQSRLSAKHLADQEFKSSQIKELNAKLEASGAQSMREKIRVMKEGLEEQRRELEQTGKMTREKSAAFIDLNNSMRKMNASVPSENITKAAEKMSNLAKSVSNLVSSAGSEAGAAVGLPIQLLKTAGNTIAAVGSMAGKSLVDLGGGIQKLAAFIPGVGKLIGGALGGLVSYAGEKMIAISETTGKVVNAVADGVGSILMQMVNLAIQLRQIAEQVHDSLVQAQLNLGGNIFMGGQNLAKNLQTAIVNQLGVALSSIDRAKITQQISQSSFGQSLSGTGSAILNMEVLKRAMGNGDYGFFGFITRMSKQSADEVMGNMTNIFYTLKKAGQEAGISLKDWSKAFQETVMQGKRYLVSEKETAAVLMKFMSMQKDLSKIGIDSASDMSKIVQNLQDFSRKLTEGEQAYFGMQAFGSTDPFEGMLKWRYGAGAEAQYVGGTNQIAISGAGETGDALGARVKALVGMAGDINTGSASSDLYARTKFFQSKGMDEQSATVLATKMDSIFSKENQKLLDETKVGAMTQKEAMRALVTSGEKNSARQEMLLSMQLKLLNTMLSFAMITALYSAKALSKLTGKDMPGVDAVLNKFDVGKSISDTWEIYKKVASGVGLKNVLSKENAEAFDAMSGVISGIGGGGPVDMKKVMGGVGFNLSGAGSHHFGGYIKRFHDGGSMSPFKALVKENEAMFLGNIGASVVPEKNINIMTNENLTSLIEGVRSNLLSSAIEGVANASASGNQSNQQTEVNVHISGNVFSMNDFKKIIKDTVIEVLGGR